MQLTEAGRQHPKPQVWDFVLPATGAAYSLRLEWAAICFSSTALFLCPTQSGGDVTLCCHRWSVGCGWKMRVGKEISLSRARIEKTEEWRRCALKGRGHWPWNMGCCPDASMNVRRYHEPQEFCVFWRQHLRTFCPHVLDICNWKSYKC